MIDLHTRKPAFSYLGTNVIIVPPVKAPKFVLSSDLQLTDNYRASITNWLCGFFGYTEIDLLDGKAVRQWDKLFVNPATAQKLKDSLELTND